VWVKTAPLDPELPIRGRYVRLRLEAQPAPELRFPEPVEPPDAGGIRRPSTFRPLQTVTLTVQDGRLVAAPSSGSTGVRARRGDRDTGVVAVLEPPVAYFIPPQIPDPSIRPAGEELWVEVTLPAKGPPRPIRLGVMRDGQITPVSW
jgi:hypothetical protein